MDYDSVSAYRVFNNCCDTMNQQVVEKEYNIKQQSYIHDRLLL